MTVSAPPAPVPAAPPPATRAEPVVAATPVHRRRRWVRFAVPLIVVALFWGATVGAHAYQQPDMSDPGTLSPLGTGRFGSSELADRLRAQGVQIDRVTSFEEAVAAARGQDATLFVPAPDMFRRSLVAQLEGMAGIHRVVLVKPGLLTEGYSGVPFVPLDTRWATATVEPGCAAPFAVRAGAAAVAQTHYAAYSIDFIPNPRAVCYGGSLVEIRMIDVTVDVVGATDPFRNDRIGESGNAALATGLLGDHGRLIWVDVHSQDPVQVQLPALQLPQYSRGNQDRTNSGNPLIDAFPAQLWAVLVLLLVGGLLLAFARARRLGPPVAEPLPVLVPASETVMGRGRLYRRIRARGSSLATLRAAAVARLARLIDPLARSPERTLAVDGPARAAFVRQIAARTGLSEATVSTVLFGPRPAGDEALVRAAADLDALLAAVVAGPLRPPPPDNPHQSGGSL
jgi:hypothetical protein